jgi:hypothetical protein
MFLERAEMAAGLVVGPQVPVDQFQVAGVDIAQAGRGARFH